MGPIEYAQAAWFTNPNHDRASVIFVGVGKSLIAEKSLLEGVMPVELIISPANSTTSWQN